MKLVLVSHDYLFAKNTIKYLKNMIPNLDLSNIINASGLDQKEIGTDALFIQKSIDENEDQDFIIVCDLGSAVLSSKLARDLTQKQVYIAKTPFVETSFAIASLLNAQLNIDEYIEICHSNFNKE